MTFLGRTLERPIEGVRGPFARPRILRTRFRSPTIGAITGGVAFGCYLAVAALLVFATHSIEGDAWSRVGNAYYMLFSRDPHLAALGFVWNPLPSLAIAPLLLFKDLWPPLVEEGFAANIVSALCMAGAVYQLRAILLELRVAPLTALGLTVLFAAHPMIVLFAANGMSEAMFILFTLVAVRHLVRWVRSDQSAALAHCGIALALLYLTRYEGIAVGGAAIALVAARSFGRDGDRLGSRLANATADALIVMTPFVFALGMFALASWVIVGSPFETFTSVYGNSSQISLGAQGIRDITGQGSSAGTIYWLRQVTGLEPAVGLAGAAAILALARRRSDLLIPLVVLGAGIAFSIWTFTTGKTFGWLRFYILVVPFVTLAAGALVAGLHTAARRDWRRASATAIATALVVGLVILGLPSALATMGDASLGREETDQIRSLLGSAPPTAGVTTFRLSGQDAALELARYLDAQALPDGAVLIDVATGFPVVLESGRPRQFVITTDRDFEAAVADPVTFGVRYVVVDAPIGYASVNAVERAHPGIYQNGAGIAQFLADFGVGAQSWRLYRITAAN